MFEKLRRKIEQIQWSEKVEPSWWGRFLRRQVTLCFYIVRELFRDRCLQQAAALTYTTLLALVPLLAVAFAFFRGFAALEGLQERAQNAIFRGVLATPLMRGMWQEDDGREPLAEAKLNRLSAEELISEAENRSRSGDHANALRLYVRALNRGVEAEMLRQQLSRLPLGRLDLTSAFQRLESAAFGRYLDAAGLPDSDPERWRRPPPAARARFQNALRAERNNRPEEAGEALSEAEELGYNPAATRRAWAAILKRRGEASRNEGRLDEAGQHYREGLLLSTDALLLAARFEFADELEQARGLQGKLRGGLGEVLLQRGREQAAVYRSLRQQGDEGQGAAIALQAALTDLETAARLLAESRRIHHERAVLLWEAGRPEEARAAYEAALTQTDTAAARGISVAVADYLRAFVEKVGRAEIGVIGALFLLGAATSLLNTIERTLNHVWNVTEKRPFWIKFTSYWTLIGLGPVLIAVGILARERLAGYLTVALGDVPAARRLVGPLGTAVGWLLPMVMMWLVLVALYKFLPFTHVNFGSAAWGAVVATVLLQLARPLFGIYVAGAVRYEKIYGSLGAVPIFLLWILLLWTIVLLGSEVAFTHQNLGQLSYRERMRQFSSLVVDRYMAARIVLYVAREFWERGEPVSAADLAETLQITTEEAAEAARRLVRLGLLTLVGEERDHFHPARDLSKLKVAEVMGIADRFRSEVRSEKPENRPYEERLESLFRSVIRAREETLEGMTFRDLLVESEKNRDKYPRGPTGQ